MSLKSPSPKSPYTSLIVCGRASRTPRGTPAPVLRLAHRSRRLICHRLPPPPPFPWLAREKGVLLPPLLPHRGRPRARGRGELGRTRQHGIHRRRSPWEEVRVRARVRDIAPRVFAPDSRDVLRACYSIQRLVGMAPHLIRTQYMSRAEGIDDWVDASGRIVLLGDAAHPSFVRPLCLIRFPDWRRTSRACACIHALC